MLPFARLQQYFSSRLVEELSTAPFEKPNCDVCFNVCFNPDAPREFEILPKSPCLNPILYEDIQRAAAAGCSVCEFLAAALNRISLPHKDEDKQPAKLWWDTSVHDNFRRRTWFFRTTMVEFFTLPGK
jgi:hypothetical protein